MFIIPLYKDTVTHQLDEWSKDELENGNRLKAVKLDRLSKKPLYIDAYKKSIRAGIVNY